jgi:MFS transporter, DHA1 family, inner membrane transport protein
MSHRFARIVLLMANFVTGLAILGPAGMLPELAAGLGVSITAAGLLVTAGAVVLCIGSPLMVWATSRLDRRLVFAGTLAVVGAGNVASAFAPDYGALLALRIAITAFAALVTPQAASTVALIVPAAERGAAIAFVFLGFTLSIAAGLPLAAFLATSAGWQAVFAFTGVAALATAALSLAALAPGMRGAAISLRSWTALAHNNTILLLLLLTIVQVSAQFIVFTYLGPLLTRLAGAGTQTIAICFSLAGVAGFVGNVIATRLVTTLKPYGTSLVALVTMLAGLVLFSVGAGVLAVMTAGIAVWGLGFAAVNSMQQARLIAVKPDLSSAAVALNTSSIYIGQSVGSALGGFLLAHDLPRALGYSAVVLMAASLGVLAMTREKAAPVAAR